MKQDKREKIKAIVQEWAATVLSQWHKRELNIDEVVNKIVVVIEEKP